MDDDDDIIGCYNVDNVIISIVLYSVTGNVPCDQGAQIILLCCDIFNWLVIMV